MQADVFCRVLDNYGDIGVTWRLVRQLHHEHNWRMRLWVDDLESFQRLEPAIKCLARQDLSGVEIINWSQATEFTPREVSIATFSCDLPEPYLAKLHQSQLKQNLWINLEYLSAEDWVEGCHQLPSLRSDGLSSHFFFPGFTHGTGGLLRETDLLDKRDSWQADRAAQRTFLESLGLSQTTRKALFPDAPDKPAARLINLFCYENAPVDSLLEVLSANPVQSVLLIPAGVHPQYHSGQHGQLLIERVPFLPQTEYDKILWTADLNFVRGEDSVVRGIWSGKPLIWQLYPQTENTHLLKLKAWLARSGLSEGICQLMLDWNPASEQSNTGELDSPSDQAKIGSRANISGYKNNPDRDHAADTQSNISEFSSVLQQQLQPANFNNWQKQAREFCNQQAALPDLAGSLNAFCLMKAASKAILPQKG